MKILVTGGLGYIGSHTVVALQEEGFEVVIIDNLSNSTIEVLEGIENITGIRPEFVQLDLCHKTAVETFFSTHKNIEGVIHFAAFKAVGESVQNPLKYYNNNISSLCFLLQEMEKHSIPNVIFSSSCTVYGKVNTFPVTENTPLSKALSPYGHTKQIGEQMLVESTESTENLQAIALRYFNPIGAHESACIGESPKGTPYNLVPYITQTAAGIRKELTVFGNDYPTKDGSCVRDYIHVVDLAIAHVVALKRLLKKQSKKSFETFNIGAGKGFSVLEVISVFEKISQIKLPYNIANRRSGDIPEIYADTTLAKNTLGWTAKRSLNEALLNAWKWQLKQQ